MPYYGSIGADSTSDPVQLRTPGYVLAEMKTVDSAIGSLARDVIASAVPASFKADLALFATDWKSFYDDNKSGIGGWWARGTSPVYNKVLEYRTLVQQWRDAFVSRGGDPSPVKLPDVRKHDMKSILIVGGLIAFSVWMWKRPILPPAETRVVKFKRAKAAKA